MEQSMCEIGKGDPLMSAAQGTKDEVGMHEQSNEERGYHVDGQGDPLFSASKLIDDATINDVKNRDSMIHHDRFHLGKADPLFQAVKQHDRMMAIHHPSEYGGKGDPLMQAAIKHAENFGESCERS
eukprot:364640_1